MARTKDLLGRSRFFDHLKLHGRIDAAAAYAGVAASTGSRWLRERPDWKQATAENVYASLEAMLTELMAGISIDLKPGEGSGVKAPFAARVSLLTTLTRTLAIDPPERIEVLDGRGATSLDDVGLVGPDDEGWEPPPEPPARFAVNGQAD